MEIIIQGSLVPAEFSEHGIIPAHNFSLILMMFMETFTASCRRDLSVPPVPSPPFL